MMLTLAAVVWYGCSDEATRPTELQQNNTTGVIRGEIDPNDVAFEYTIPARGADPIIGPFVLRGSNIHYVDSLSALSVDLTIENQGEVSHPLPIGLTFVSFMPTDVTVENPDNDEHGPGAAILFEFENEDLSWTPGEVSLPRQTLFGVADATSIGFVAQVVIPEDTTSGTIGGIVWHDVNEDGVMDNDEPGIGGVTVHLVVGGPPPLQTSNDDYRMSTTTAPDGSYRFDDLDAGYYQVIWDFPNPDWMPTTPTVINVLLVEKDGVVNDFLLANFGLVPRDDTQPPPTIEVGDYVKVNGDYMGDREGHIIARSIELIKCEAPPPPDSMLTLTSANGDWDGDVDGCDDPDTDRCHDYACWGLKNALMGPVTWLDRDNCLVEIMGSWVRIVKCDTSDIDIPERTSSGDSTGVEYPWLDIEDVNVGDHVLARVFMKEGDNWLYANTLKEWNGTPEKVYGKVERLSAPSGPLEAIYVLGVEIAITSDTDIYYCE
jgi:hypothetical protein